jgi:outer membrane protein assembly factor BamB
VRSNCSVSVYATVGVWLATTGLLVAGAAGAPGQQDVAGLLSTARERETAGQIDAAAEAHRQAIALLKDPEALATQWIELGQLYKQAARPLLEAETLDKALDYVPPYDPRHWSIIERLLLLYRTQLDRPGSAISLLESEVAGLEPGRGNVQAWLALAMSRQSLGDGDWADNVYPALMKALRDQDTPVRKKLIERLESFEEHASKPVAFNRNVEAAALIGKFHTRVSEGKAVEAGELIAELLTKYPDAFFDHPGAAGVSSWLIARELLNAMPAEAKRAYEQACLATMARIIPQGRSEVIERFAYTHPWESIQFPLMLAAGDALLDEGRPARALGRYRQALAAAKDQAGQLEAQIRLARSAILAGEPVPTNLPLDARVTVAGKSMALADAIRQWQAETPRVSTEPVAMEPLSQMKHNRLRLQQAPLAMRKWQAGWQTGLRSQNPKATAAFVPYVPAGDRNQVFINTSEMLYAVDPVNERLLWARNPSETFVAEIMPPSLENVPLLNTPKRFYTSVSDNSVFFRFNWASRAGERPRSAVYAARREDGVLRWSTENLPNLDRLRFVSDPAYAGGVVVVAAWEAAQIPVFYLIGLDADTGELLWKTFLFSGIAFPSLRESGLLDQPLGVPPPTIRDGAVYFAPGMGILSRVNLYDGQLEWLQSYPRVSEFGPDNWAGQFIFNKPSSAVILSGPVIMAAPPDEHGILFFEVGTGKLLRQYQSLEFRNMFAADDGLVFAQQGGDIVAVKIDDATVAWKATLPASVIIGSPTLSPRGIICGTREGLLVLSPRDGKIVDRYPPVSFEGMGTPLDLGDRIVAVSESAVDVLAAKVNDGRDWQTPRSPEPTPLKVEMESPPGLVRWALPAPDRSNFHLSSLAPDLVLLQSWETYELRRSGPVPTLLWEFPWLTWPRTIQFDESLVVLEYAGGRMMAIDVGTGKQRWEADDRAMAGERDDGGAIVSGDRVIWFNHDRVTLLDAKDGRKLGSRRFAHMPIRGICPTPEGIGLFLFHEPGPAAILLDRADAREIRQIPLGESGTPCRSIACARAEGFGTATVLPIVLVDGQRVGFVDFAAGKVDFKPIPHGGATGLVRCQDVLCVLGNNGLAKAFVLPGMEPLSPLSANQWCVADGVEYCAADRRIVAQNLKTGQREWESLTFAGEIAYLCVAGRCVLAVENLGKAERLRSRVVAIDKAKGEIIDQLNGLTGAFPIVGHVGECLYASDLGYFYRFGEPQAGRTHPVEVRQDRTDVDALVALPLARDQQHEVIDAPPPAEFSPVVDGDLSEWASAKWTRLEWPDAWRPDPALLSPTRPRRPTGNDDCSAEIAWAKDAGYRYLAVRVRDDVHDPARHRPLWRGDSVWLFWQNRQEAAIRPRAICAALVDEVPCMELGSVPYVQPATIESTHWPVWLNLYNVDGDVPWLRRRQSGAATLTGVQFAARRNSGARLTLYEIAIPVNLLSGSDNPADALLWDVAINDSDGQERKGALELGTSLLQMQRPVGFAEWPASEQATQPARVTR